MKNLFTTLLSVTMCIMAAGALAQSRWVSGRVCDQSGAPVTGAAVTVEGSQHGAVTDLNGRYRIQAEDNDVLVFQCLGYERAEVVCGTRTAIDVELTETVHQLDDVVVTGYQTISRERATGAFDIIDKSKIDKPAGNIAGRLIGAVAGMTAAQDAYGNPVFEIRGRSSLSAEATQPLLVVDGFAIEGGFGSINPNDVESITVLKDAAAASIWGAKSANGVIVITTKNAARHGAGGGASVTVDYSGFVKVSPKLDMDYTLSQASVSDVIDYETGNFGKMDWSTWAYYYCNEQSDMGGRSSVYELMAENYLGHLSDEEMKARIDALRGNDNRRQLRRHFLQNPVVHQENVSINIAADKSRTTLSALYQNDREHFKLRNSNKYMVNFRNTTTLFKWLDLTLNGSYTHAKKGNSGYASLPGLSPYEMITDQDGNPIRYGNVVNLRFVERHVPVENFPYEDWSWNPLEEMQNRKLTTATANARIQAGLTFKIWQGLTFDSRVQYEMADSQTHDYYNEATQEVRYRVNTYSTWNRTTGEVTPHLPKGGMLDQSRTRYDVMTIRNQINFNRTFADRHSIAFVAGVETIDRVTQGFTYPRTYGYNDETLTVGTYPTGVGGSGIYKITNWDGMSISLPYKNGFTHTTDRYFSAFGNLSYTYDDRYSVSGSVRSDASNLITDDPAYRYAPFWSAGASWQIANERFMAGVRAVDKLTLRVTYGYNGNVDKSTTFKPLVSTSASASTVTGDFTGKMDSYGNPTLRWERTGTWNAGVDFSLWRGKLHGKLDVYDKHSIDLIANVTLPTVQGAPDGIKINNGEMTNRGFELEVGSAVRISKHASWNGSLTVAYNKSRIRSLKQEPLYAYSLVYYRGRSESWMEGYDINSLWAYRYGGLRNGGSDETPVMKPTIATKSGDYAFLESFPSGEAMDFSYYMGTTVAPWNMAFSTSFRIRDFDLSLIITGKFGHKFMRESFNYPSMNGRAIPNAKYGEILNADPERMMPLPQNETESRYYFWNRFYPFFSYLAENAAHLRLQEFNATYNVPVKNTRPAGVKALQIYLQCNNPFSIYFNRFGEDPEFPRGDMRLQASYTIGIKCKF